MMDFHCHLDLYKKPLEVFDAVKNRKIFVLAVTTSPRAYIKTKEYFRSAENVYVAVGLHPELVEQRAGELGLLLDYMKECDFIGEIGIDGTNRNSSSLILQRDIFEIILKNARHYGGRIMSIHSRGAVKDVLDLLDKYGEKSVPILHWFTGTSKEAERALEMGCWFSINPNMCKTSSGKNIISKIPIDRILPETDAPFAHVNGEPYMPWDNTVSNYISEKYGISLEKTNNIFEENKTRLLQDREIL